jgi:tetratricopeptide (TPR) repeat protein
MRTNYCITKRNLLIAVLSAFIIFSMISCKKYLDAKPDKSLVIPSTLNDLQAILDNSSRMNEGPSYGIASSDNYYLNDADYNTLTDEVKKAYTWSNFSYNYPNDWATIYNVIYPANIALEGIEKITPTAETQLSWNTIKGSALLYRALSLLQGTFIFCNAYDPSTANTDMGMVLRLTSDFNAPSQRSTLQETFDRIIKDLKEAASLLPNTPIHVIRPSKAAAFGILARTYLSMREYDSCKKYTNLCLQIKSDLFDFNTISNSGFILPQFNKEVIMATLITQPVYYCISQSFTNIDSNLYNSYADNDLRKSVFFESTSTGYHFIGSYSGSPYQIFTGLATDEVYLMRAECNARLGNVDSALSDLNKLMRTKWSESLFIPFTANSSEEALQLVLHERRKELEFRGLRWMDIKRLNKEGAGITLLRNVDGQVYTLPPDDKRYALPLPLDIVNSTGVKQNPQ